MDFNLTCLNGNSQEKIHIHVIVVFTPQVPMVFWPGERNFEDYHADILHFLQLPSR